jgi:magnesium-transporting ATPase (P-type)
MGIWRQLAEYLYIKKKDPNAPRNTNTRLMHGMNRISLFIFLIAIIIMLVRFVFIPLFR